ncbi:HupE/UreJ family protein [Aureivirga sp. CE67]|uniref:HupE/UreJ family protein n=1 Tax=Aureivirga sp. CE67 TaxID=1788983 RepID=UPI0018C965C9|nr:HupE/UreJ family protein [Aureivirga sp. CE67]
MNDFIFFLNEGINHVLDINAYDHVLFLIALAVIYSFKEWKKAVSLITLFTVGHTVTLLLAAYQVVAFPSEVIEFLIPVTILITCIFNITQKRKEKSFVKENLNLIFAFFFGLIHGLGFSSYFKMLIGSTENKFVPLLEFALGIEFAQIIIIFAIFSIEAALSRYAKLPKREWILITSSMVAGVVFPILMENKIW